MSRAKKNYPMVAGGDRINHTPSAISSEPTKISFSLLFIMIQRWRVSRFKIILKRRSATAANPRSRRTTNTRRSRKSSKPSHLSQATTSRPKMRRSTRKQAHALSNDVLDRYIEWFHYYGPGPNVARAAHRNDFKYSLGLFCCFNEFVEEL